MHWGGPGELPGSFGWAMRNKIASIAPSCDPQGFAARNPRPLLLVHSVDSLRCEGSDAIEAKRTCRERRKRVDLMKMTRGGHQLF